MSHMYNMYKRGVCIIDHYPLGNQRIEISGGLTIMGGTRIIRRVHLKWLIRAWFKGA